MAIHAQSSCTLSTITDVEAVYTYYYLSDSTITVNEAPKDNVNPPGASTITVISDEHSYVWQITEPQLDIEDDVIQTAVGKLYYIECVEFSDGTYDWGPLMTSSTYAAAKAAYNLSSQALSQAQAANEATALLGGHFIYNSTWETTNTPHSANVVQTVLKNGIDVTQDPTKWDYNVHIGVNGIRLRNNELVLSEWTANTLKFYRPGTTTVDAELNSNGLKITNGSIVLGTTDGTAAGNITLSNTDFNRSINETPRSNLRLAIGSKFGVKNDGTLYASNAVISGQIIVGTGSTISADTTINGIAASSITSNVTKALQQSVEYITGTQSSSTNAWTGVTTDSSLVVGKTIAYKLPYAGTSTAATLNLTLSGGSTTGAKTIYRNTSTVTTQFPANSVITMTYDGTYWRITGMGSDTNYYDRTAYKASVTAESAIPATCIGVFNTSGNLIQLSSSSSFDITRPILYIGTAYTSSALTQTNNYTFWGTPFDLTLTHAITGAAPGKPVYIVGDLNRTTFSPTDIVLTCTEPTEVDNLVYIRLGLMSSITHAVLESDHPLYAYGSNGFTIIQGEKGETGAEGATGPAGPEGVVIVSLNNFNWTVNPPTANLTAKLLIDGKAMSPSSYKWTINNESNSLGSNNSITVTNFNGTYNCIITWVSGENEYTQVGSIDMKALLQVYDEAAKQANNYLSSDNTGIMIYDGTNTAQQFPSAPVSNTNNVLIDNQGIYIRKGTTPMATFNSDGVVLYQNGVSIATYGTDIILGKQNDTHIKISTQNGLEFFEANNDTAIASMSEETLFITQAKLLNLLRIDKFVWKIRGNNRISLRYEPS